MADPPRLSQRGAGKSPESGAAGAVRLELSRSDGPALALDFDQDSILIGTVPGCDLRLPASDLPPVIALLLRDCGGVRLRKLTPALPLQVNADLRSEGPLRSGDVLRVGGSELRITFQFEDQGLKIVDRGSKIEDRPSRILDPRSSILDSRSSILEFPEQVQLLQAARQKLAEAQRQFEEDQRDWELDAERQAEVLASRSRQLLDQEKALASSRSLLEKELAALQAGREELDRRQEEQRRAQQALDKHQKQLDAEQTRLADERDQLEKAKAQQQADVANLERLQIILKEREPALDQRENQRDQPGPTESAPNTLPLRPRLSPADQKLADLLAELTLVDQATLASLLSESGEGSGALRDALRKRELLTPYQIEHLEAGRLEALRVGPLRIVDRLRLTSIETVYRVFDPRRGEEGLLRRLSPSVGSERQAEFRRQFGQASLIRHDNLAETWELLEMDGAPAALQEWVTGIPSTEWTSRAAAPSVWLRLLSQAAAGIQAAHAAGLAHGRLHSGRLLLTEQGQLKLCGLGEPLWLSAGARTPTDPPAEESKFAADLQALGQIAREWSAPSKSGRLGERGLPHLVPVIIRRLLAKEPSQRYKDAAALLEDLARVRAQVPDDPRAWERLRAFVADRLGGSDELDTHRRCA